MTTLGRGGSDYSAVALAASLRCSTHLLKADVDGVYSADPRTAPFAVRFDSLEHDEAIVLAANGAKVLQRKAADSPVIVACLCGCGRHTETDLERGSRHRLSVHSCS